eukprot:319470-Chlamydomonas_euryale.AAC.1
MLSPVNPTQFNPAHLRLIPPMLVPGRYSVPILWDKKKGTIVNNESSEIIRMFNDQFNDIAKVKQRSTVGSGRSEGLWCDVVC